MIHRVIFRYKFIWGPKSQVSVFPLHWPHFKGTFEGCHKPQASLNNYCLESIFSCHQNPRKYRLFFFPQTSHISSTLMGLLTLSWTGNHGQGTGCADCHKLILPLWSHMYLHIIWKHLSEEQKRFPLRKVGTCYQEGE